MLRVPLLHPSVTLTSATQLASFSEPLLPTFFPSSHLLFYFPFSFAVLFCLDCFCCLLYSLTLHSLRVAVSSLGGCSFCPCSESRQHMPEPWGSLVSACVHVNVCGTRFLGGTLSIPQAHWNGRDSITPQATPCRASLAWKCAPLLHGTCPLWAWKARVIDSLSQCWLIGSLHQPCHTFAWLQGLQRWPL